jgi:hypothetical protein
VTGEIAMWGGEAGPTFSIARHVENWITGEDGLVQKNWDMGGWPQPWAALKPATIREKARLGFNPTADQTRSGKLELMARGPASVVADESQIRVAITQGQCAYAAAHQYGSMGTQRRQLTATLKAMRRRKKTSSQPVKIGMQMPARPPYQSPTGQECLKEVSALAHGIMKEAGFE